MVRHGDPASFAAIDPRIDYFERGAATQNFGDYLPELFCLALLRYPKVDADVFRLVGSVISERWLRWDLSRATGSATGLIALWLCGARNASPLSPSTRARCLFFGVRGPLTRDLLGLPADTVIGDPGLLAPLIHAPTPHPETRGRAICIPHIEDPKTPAELLALSGADVLVSPEIASSEAALREILDKIAGAEFVLSGSLHGAILACAYGVPFAFWDTGHLDAPFKWEDFAKSVGVPSLFAKDLGEGRRIWRDEIREVLRRPPLAPMLDICPFTVRPDMLLRALAHDGVIDDETAGVAADALARLPGSSLAAARDHADLSARRRDARGRLVPAAKKALGLSSRRAARALSPKFVRAWARALRLRGS